VGFYSLDPWSAAVTFVILGFCVAASAKPHAGRTTLFAWAAIVVLLSLPWICDARHVGPRAVVTMTCVALFTPKLVDALSAPAHWHARPWREWIAYLPMPCVLVHRGREGLPIAPPNRTPAELLARAAVQMTIGGLLLAWAMRADFRDSSFWLEHGVKLVAVYLIGFDGAFLMLEGLVRALGVAIIDQTRDPALATTPANFWRRYNREAGRLLYADVFRPIGGLRYPRAAIVVTFLINGVLHEYLAWILIGSVQGYQMAFFALHGLATALTFELRPRGTLGRAVGMAITLLFVYVTSVLFFASVSQFFPWYARGPLRPW
jgi:hypothetical protein